MLLRLFIAALWSHAGRGLFIVFFVTFPFGILGQVWYLIVSFSDLCHLSYFCLALIFFIMQCTFVLLRSFSYPVCIKS